MLSGNVNVINAEPRIARLPKIRKLPGLKFLIVSKFDRNTIIRAKTIKKAIFQKSRILFLDFFNNINARESLHTPAV